MKLQDYIANGAPQGERNNALFAAILQAREDGWDDFSIKEGLGERARADGLTEGEIQTTLKSAMRHAITPRVKSDKPNNVLDWHAKIEAVRAQETVAPPIETRSQEAQCIDFLTALFEPHEIVAYNCKHSKNEAGEIAPSGRGIYHRQATEICAEIANAGIKSTFMASSDAGAWVRLNPMDGEGIAAANVKEYRHCLVESDKIPVDKQIEILKRLKLPISTLVHSGGKSVHAAVKIDAGTDRKLYDARVKQVYEILNQNGFEIDRQNKDPGRLSRLAGIDRQGKTQSLIAVHIGAESWQQWEALRTETNTGLPDPKPWTELKASNMPLAEEIIGGVLRRGHKMLLGGPSKAGKSFALIQLAAAVCSGGQWLGHKCKQGRVMYVNLEIDEPSFRHRVLTIQERIPFQDDLFMTWNLRGRVTPLTVLSKHLILFLKHQPKYDLLILDPIYKINEGDENSARDMTIFCNAIERVATDTGAAIAFAHHFSKGAQGAKASIDRASGSGVFGRDPDAIGTLTEWEGNKNVYDLEWTLREFASPPGIRLLFNYPVHTVIEAVEGENPKAGRPKKDDFVKYLHAFDTMNLNDSGVLISEIAEYLGVSEKTIRRKFSENSAFIVEQSKLIKSIS